LNLLPRGLTVCLLGLERPEDAYLVLRTNRMIFNV